MSILSEYYLSQLAPQRVASGGVAPSEAAGESASASVLGELTPLAIQALQTRRAARQKESDATAAYGTMARDFGSGEPAALNVSPAQGGNG